MCGPRVFNVEEEVVEEVLEEEGEAVEAIDVFFLHMFEYLK